MHLYLVLVCLLSPLLACEKPSQSEDGRTLAMTCTDPIFRFAALADFGTVEANDPGMAIAQHLHTHKSYFDFIVAGGDNFYEEGVDSVNDPKWQTTWADRYRVEELGLPWMAVVGNHDVIRNYEAQTQYHASGHANGCNFFFLDTEHLGTEQLDWLDMELGNATVPLNFVVGHTHIYTVGVKGDETVAEDPEIAQHFVTLDAILHRYNVTAYISGHEHNLQHLDKDGLDYLIVGGGGKHLRPDTTSSLAKSIMFENTFGYGVFEVNLDLNTAHAEFQVFDSLGKFLHPNFFALPNGKKIQLTD